jgi:hypothetical protein
MTPKTPTKAIAVIVGLWVLACAAALALATTSNEAVAQQGCGGGASPSPSRSASPSASAAASQLPGETLIPTLPVSPGPQAAVPQPPRFDPHVKVPVAAAQQQASCATTVTISYESGKSPKFTGKVGSDEPMCKRARNVTVKKVKRGKDLRVGKAVTNAKGVYNVPSRQAKGRFYATVSRATVENDDGQTVTCKPGRSRTIRP